jgi:hypothetical protein
VALNGNGYISACSQQLNYVKGARHYELSNHDSTWLTINLGNVLSVVSDRKIEVDESYTFQAGGGTIDPESVFFKMNFSLPTKPNQPQKYMSIEDVLKIQNALYFEPNETVQVPYQTRQIFYNNDDTKETSNPEIVIPFKIK